jgi:hypothetical protein
MKDANVKLKHNALQKKMKTSRWNAQLTVEVITVKESAMGYVEGFFAVPASC